MNPIPLFIAGVAGVSGLSSVNRPSAYAYIPSPPSHQRLVNRMRQIRPATETLSGASSLGKKKEPGQPTDITGYTQAPGAAKPRIALANPIPCQSKADSAPEPTYNALPAEIRAKIFSHLELAELLTMSGFGNIDANEARFAFRRVPRESQLRQIFAQIRLGDQRLVPFCRAIDMEIATLTETQQGRTPLMEAIQFNHPVIVKQLLALPGVNVNATDRYRLSAMHFAALQNNEAIVLLLLAQPDINIHAGNIHGSTALHCAATFGHITTVKLLLARQDANVNAADYCGATALHYAVGMGRNLAISRRLPTMGCVASIEALYDFTRSPGVIQPHHSAALAQLLATPGIDYNRGDRFGSTPLHYAIANGLIDIIAILLKLPDIDINAANVLGHTPLHMAIFNGKPEGVQLLLKAPGIDVNYRDNNQCIPLQYAIRDGLYAIAHFLLDIPGIDINSADGLGWTSLHCALAFSRKGIAKRLLTMQGIDINAAQAEGWTALHFASMNGDIPLVELLLSKPHIKVNARQGDGWTPLHCAALNGFALAAKLLLGRPEIEVNAIDNQGCNALFYALIRHHRDTANILQQGSRRHDRRRESIQAASTKHNDSTAG